MIDTETMKSNEHMSVFAPTNEAKPVAPSTFGYTKAHIILDVLVMSACLSVFLLFVINGEEILNIAGSVLRALGLPNSKEYL